MQQVGTPRTTLAVSLSRARRPCGTTLLIRFVSVSLSSPFTNVFRCFSLHNHCSLASPRPPPPSLIKLSMPLLRPTRPGADRASCPVSVLPSSPLSSLSVSFPHSPSYSARLQNQIRSNANALAASIVLEQGKTLAGRQVSVFASSNSQLVLMKDAHGDVLRGLQVVETAIGITSTLLGDKIEGLPDFPPA